MKKFNPLTPSLRYQTVTDFSGLSTGGPYKPLTRSRKRKNGRNVYGRITVRRLGGGHKRRLRIVDFKQEKNDRPAKVERLEYDPNRSARLALVLYPDGGRRYRIAYEGCQAGDVLSIGKNVKVKAGNRLPLGQIPVGTEIHNLEFKPGLRAQLVRAAGSYATVMAQDGKQVVIRLPSKEVRYFSGECYATIGHVGNAENNKVVLGKAGRSRWLGHRPKVRGVAMNPVDHPMGGGEGKASGGGHPRSPWGLKSKGKKTRKRKLLSNRLIISRRK